MVKYISYHGSIKKNCDSILKNGLFIKKYIVASESNKQRGTKKLPGSFGYGFYTFIDDKELCRIFANRMCGSNEVAVLEVNSEIVKTNIIDLTNANDQRIFHTYFNNNHQTAERLLNNFGNNKNTKKQHVKDGIVIELFISSLFTKKKTRIDAVVGESYTPGKENFFSYIPNGKELCIRNNNVITNIKSC